VPLVQVDLNAIIMRAIGFGMKKLRAQASDSQLVSWRRGEDALKNAAFNGKFLELHYNYLDQSAKVASNPEKEYLHA
jgi:hypothetical protein